MQSLYEVMHFSFRNAEVRNWSPEACPECQLHLAASCDCDFNKQRLYVSVICYHCVITPSGFKLQVLRKFLELSHTQFRYTVIQSRLSVAQEFGIQVGIIRVHACSWVSVNIPVKSLSAA